MSLRTHLDVLEDSSTQYSERAVFQLPVPSPGSTEIKEWRPVTYAQFKRDVETYAKFWARRLADGGLPRRSIVGLWLGGMSYHDVLHIYGVTRANYVPQLFSLRLPNPDVVYELLHRAKAVFLIYDQSFDAIVSDSPVPRHAAVDVQPEDVEGETLPSLAESGLQPDSCIVIFHTSGSTSGSPKLVPCSLRWVNSMVDKSAKVAKPKNTARQDVSVWMGSVCHIGQTFMLVSALQHGSCTIQPSAISFSSSELMAMISNCSLNRLNQFATFLANHLRNSRNNPKLLDLLKNLDEVLFSGLPLAREEEEWARRNGIQLRNLFGSTECGAMMLSIGVDGQNSNVLRPIEGTSYQFTAPPSSNTSSSQATNAEPHTNANANLLELIIRSDSGDCPDTSLRQPDGHYHTGDLFLEVKPDSYVFRGRDDDWIKSENSLRCDTKAIEDNVRATCADLIAECIVVGNGRPSPTLFVEPKVAGNDEKLKKDIIRRTRHFHARRYLHERITATKFVVVVPHGSLPRTATKGNVRRKAVEEAYKEELDKLYGISP